MMNGYHRSLSLLSADIWFTTTTSLINRLRRNVFLSSSKLQQRRFGRLACRVTIQIDVRGLDSLCVAVLVRIFKVKVRQKESGEDVILQLRKSLSRTRMPGNTPSDKRILLRLALCAAGQVAARVPAVRLGIDFWVHVNFGNVVHDARPVGDGVVSVLEFLARGIAAEGRARRLQADALCEAHLENLEFGFPGLVRDGGQTLWQREGGVCRVFIGDGFDLVAGASLPFRGLGEVDEDPSGIDSGVELACKEGAEDKLRSK